MLDPEPYNILHVGTEYNSLLDAKMVRTARRAQFAKLGVALMGSAVVLTVFGVAFAFGHELKQNQQKVESLIDEVGSLSEANFNLQQKVAGLLKPGTSSAGNLATDISAASEDGTLDVLILGTNGALTDTIMVASVNKAKQKITLLSVPRDLYINGRRINEYYHYYGADTLERMVESVTGLSIDHYIQVDLDGFVSIVDLLGGLDIYVSESIYDGLYPNSLGGYDPYSITPGQYHMSGTEVLKYARSRKSTTDFDRAARQQKIVDALSKKIVQENSGREMKDLTSLFQTGVSSLTTDLSVLDMVAAYYDYSNYSVSTGFVLTSSNYLYSLINESGAYILLPKAGNFDEIHGVIASLVN